MAGSADVSIHQLGDLDIDFNKYGKFIHLFAERSHYGITAILKQIDVKKIAESQIMNYLRKACKQHCELFSQSNFSKLPDTLKKEKTTSKTKMELVLKFCHLKMLSFMYYVRETEEREITLINAVIEGTVKLITTSKDVKPDNYLMICMLNANLSRLQYPLLKFSEACRYSFELSNVTSGELFQYETFFWYITLHWPTPTEKKKNRQLKTYDEEKFCLCLKQLKKIQQENSYFVNNRAQRHNLQHSPLYYLTDGAEYQKLDENSGFHLLRLEGTIKDKSNLEFTLPGGTPLTIRAANFRINRGSHTQKVTFSLGFTLAGPVAYYIEKSESEILRFNDTCNDDFTQE